MALTRITSELITDGTISTDDLSSTAVTSISGSSASSSFSSRITLVEDGTTTKTLISSSAQIASDISGSFTAGTGLDLSSGELSVDVSDFMANGSNNRIITATGTDAQNAEANLTFDGTTLTLGSSTTASFQRLDAQVISASVVEVDASTLKIGGTEINKTLVDNVKLNFSSAEVQSSDTLETTAATGSFSGFVSSSLFLLSEVQGAQLTPQAGGIMFSGSAFYLGFE